MFFMQIVRRLYKHFQPDHYQLELVIDRKGRSFQGIVTISGHHPKTSLPIALHAKDLQINSIAIDDTVVSFEVHDDEVTITPQLTAGGYRITVDFTGIITDTMHGLYPCYYAEGEDKKELVMTQFESHHAREVFPCIDEPEAKATFSLTLTTEPDVTVISNTPMASQHTSSGQLVTSFETTPRMSTYLLAWVIGDLQKKSATTSNGTMVNVYGTHAQDIAGFDYPLARAVDLIEFYEDYFGVSYPLSKCDHVAVPDFSAAAMENWGLITYRESCLLITENGSPNLKQYIATVIAHELAHQWFGNLVTMRWWDDLWLNESFANVMQYIAIDSLYPDWNVWHMFHTLETTIALSRDQLPSIQPVLHEINHPDDIGPAFDKAITYAKGSRIIRMMIELMGHKAFRDGMKQYFETYAYGNTTRDDLWRSLQSSQHDIPSFMTSWLSQPGFPVVSVSANMLSLQRFYEDDGSSWSIPLWLDTAWTVIDTSAFCPEENIINHQAIGHYIMHYDQSSFDILLKNFSQRTPVEQAEIIYEHALLAQSGDAPTHRLFLLLEQARNSQYDVVWATLAIVFTMIHALYMNPEHTSFDEYVQRYIAPTLDRLGLTNRDNESDNDRKIRSIVLQLAIKCRDTTHITQLANHYKTIDIKTSSGSEQFSLLAATINHDPTAFDELFSLYGQLQNSELKENLMHALVTTHDPTHIDTIIVSLTNTDLIKPQSIPWWYMGLLNNPIAQDKIWLWLESHWKWIEETYQGDSLTIEKFAMYAAKIITGDIWYRRYDEFFTAHPIKCTERVIATGKESIDLRTQWSLHEPDMISSYGTMGR